MSGDEKRLAEIVAGFNGRTRYEGQSERADEFLYRLLSERTAELERVTYERDLWKDVSARQADWEKLWAESFRARAEQAESSLAAAREMLRDLSKTLRDGGSDFHRYQGECPDPSQPDSRDPNCPACVLVKSIDAFTPKEGANG